LGQFLDIWRVVFGDDKSFGVDAAAQEIHGCCGVGAVWFDAVARFGCESLDPP
jgi:hypothetical protein